MVVNIAALTQLERAVQMAPSDALGHFLLAGQLRRLGNDEAAVVEFLNGESLLRTDSRDFESMRFVLRYRLGLPPYFSADRPEPLIDSKQ